MEKKLLIILLLIAQGWNISWQAKPKTEKSLGLFTKKEHHYDVQHGSTKSKREAGDGSELLMEVQQQFYSNVEETIDVLGMRQKGEILVHTSNQGEDFIMNLNKGTKVQLRPKIYSNFMTLSHLAVTAISIILPDLLENYTLPNNFSSSSDYVRMVSFQNSLEKLNSFGTDYGTDEQNDTAVKIITKVLKFVNDTLISSGTVNMRYLQRFVNGLAVDHRDAARFAVKDYYGSLNEATSEIVNPNQWSVVIAVQEFSYRESFLVKYYERFLETSYPERIILIPQLLCNASDLTIIKEAVANDNFSQRISELFNNGVLIPPHLILSDTARDIICSGALNFTIPESCIPTFEGFESRVDKVYVILIVVFLATTIISFIVVLSVIYEDRLMKKENNSRLAKMEGPSLLTPISQQASTNHQRQKKLTDSKRTTSDAPGTEL